MNALLKLRRTVLSARRILPTGLLLFALAACGDNDVTVNLPLFEHTFDGSVTTVAGLALTLGDVDGNPGTTARFDQPVDVDSDGTYLYITDQLNDMVRRIDPATTAVTTVAGANASPGSADGIGVAAQFLNPRGVKVVGGYAYVADALNHLIRRIDLSTTAVLTIAGDGTNVTFDGTGTAAQFNGPRALDSDGTNLYIVEDAGGVVRKMVLSTGVVTTIAGGNAGGGVACPGAAQASCKDGTGTAAAFDFLRAVKYFDGALYLSDSNNNRIRKLDLATLAVTTLAGEGTGTFSNNADPLLAQFNGPRDIVTDGYALFIADAVNHRIRRVDLQSGAVTTVAGTGATGSANGPVASATFNEPHGLVIFGLSLYVTERLGQVIRRID